MAKNFNSYTNGTAALKIPRWVESPDEATIIKFPVSRSASHAVSKEAPAENTGKPSEKAGPLGRLLESSEMYCSLRLESMLGCPYHLFTREGVAVLSAGAAAIGVISLIFGA